MKKRFNLAVIIMTLLVPLFFSSCSGDDEPSGSAGRLVGTWKLVWDYNYVPHETTTMKFSKNGELQIKVSFNGDTEEAKIKYKATDNTFTMYDSQHSETVFYRINGKELYIYDDESDYELDRGGSLEYKSIWKKQ